MGTRSTVVRIRFAQNEGFGLIELLVAVGMFAVVVMSITALNLQLSARQAQAVAPVQLDVFRRNLIALTLGTASWNFTIHGPLNATAMACLANTNLPCTQDGTPNGVPISGQTFAMYDASNTLFYDATNSGNGVTASGAPCGPNTSYGAYSATGNDQCPFRFQLAWSASCTQGNCLGSQVQVKVNATLSYSPLTKSEIINPANYSMPTTIP